MFKYQYKERTYAEEILKNGFTSKHISYELRILVKYYKELGYKPKERKELICKFCEEHLDGYDRVTHFKLINSVLNYGSNKKNILVEIESVSITNEELKHIDNLSLSHDYKKVVFTLLVLDKLNKKFHETRNENISEEHYFGGDRRYKELVSTSKISLKKNKQIHEIIGELANDDILEIKSKGNIKLSFVYGIPEDDSVGLNASTFDNIGLYYDLHTGENRVKECECCGIPIKVKSNRKTYCDECWKDIRAKQNRENFKKWYDKQSSNQLEKR